MYRNSLAVSFLVLVAAPTQRAAAQCASEWSAGFPLPRPNSTVRAAITFDDGSGPALFLGGDFTRVAGVNANRLARWSPTGGWSAMAGGVTGTTGFERVLAFCIYDDGSGAALYAGGIWSHAGGVASAGVARWNGASWSALGSGIAGPLIDTQVRALCVHDDGSGPKLYAGGNFTSVDGAAAGKIARWDGAQWEAFGGGIGGQPGDLVHALASYTDPVSGTAMLYAGGSFSVAGGVWTPALARWDGTSFGLAGAGANGIVHALRVFDDGGGAKLYAGGSFTWIGTPTGRIARWDGSAWAPVGTSAEGGIGSTGEVLGFGVSDLGAGPRLVIAGRALSPRSVFTWDGTSLAVVTGGPQFNSEVFTVEPFDVGAGERLLVGGSYLISAEGDGRFAAVYDGAAWSLLPNHPGGVTGHTTYPFASDFQTVEHPAPVGRCHYVGGGFNVAGGEYARCVARLDANGWSSIGGLLAQPAFETELRDLEAFDFGAGPELVVVGDFTSAGGTPAPGIAHYDGATWNALPAPPLMAARLLVHDVGLGAGPELFVAGTYTTPSGPSVVRWTGSTWDPLPSIASVVFAMESFDDGSGRALYVACGASSPINRIRRWRGGSSWEDIGVGFGPATGDSASCFAIHDRGFGPELYAGCLGVVRVWNGTQWNAVVSASGSVTALASYDDGSGPALYLGGEINSGQGTSGIARWNGASISALGAGTFDVRGLAVLDLGAGPRLFVGGAFLVVRASMTQEIDSAGIAMWGSPCPPAGDSFCSGDGSATACPCGNAGAPGHGCATSFDANGAALVGSGVPRVSADSLALDATGVSNSVVTFMQGTFEHNSGQGSVFGDGLRCAGGSIIRLGSVLAVGNAARYPTGAQQPISIRGVIPPLANVTRTYQVWYRNVASFCTSATFNLTNGVRTFWAP